MFTSFSTSIPYWCDLMMLYKYLYSIIKINNLYHTVILEVCIPKCHFPGTGFFPEKPRKFPVPSIQEHSLPGPVLVPKIKREFLNLKFRENLVICYAKLIYIQLISIKQHFQPSMLYCLIIWDN